MGAPPSCLLARPRPFRFVPSIMTVLLFSVTGPAVRHSAVAAFAVRHLSTLRRSEVVVSSRRRPLPPQEQRRQQPFTSTGSWKVESSRLRSAITDSATEASKHPSTSSSSSESTTSSTDVEEEEDERFPVLGSSTKRRKQQQQQKQQLSWETFEFGASPKWDQRFDSSRTVVAGNEAELEAIRRDEAQRDQETAQQLNRQNNAWKSLSPELVQQATDVLQPFVNEKRLHRVRSVLHKRTRHTRFLFENPVNPSNVFACLRTMDSFGIQYVEVVVDPRLYQGKAALVQKRGMRTAMGSAQWLTLRIHGSTAEAIQTLREEENCVVWASDLNPQAHDIRHIRNWSHVATTTTTTNLSTDATKHNDDDNSSYDRPICIVMGNEETGISDEMRQLADGCFTLPMVGFAESFNLSVATAITLAHLSAASAHHDDDANAVGGPPLRPGDLSDHEFNCLFLQGLLNSLPQKRMSRALLKRHNIELPPELKI